MGDANKLGQLPSGGPLGRPFATPDAPANFYNIYMPGQWYIPGAQIGAGGQISAQKLTYHTPVGSFLYAVPNFFGVAGQITDIATYMNGNGGGSNQAHVAIYRANSAKTAPAGRIFTALHTVPNFTNQKTESNNLALNVDAGEQIWFVMVTSQPQCLGLNPAYLYPMLGSNFDGSGGATPLCSQQVGYREPYAFAAGTPPPANWSGTTKMLGTDCQTGGNLGAATMLFKFSPQ